MVQANQKSFETSTVCPPVGWHGRLLDAATPSEVIELVRDFVASWSPEEMATLPRDCRPGKIVDSEDVAGIAFALVRRSCAADRLGDDLLQRLAAFFTDASQQLSRLTPSPPIEQQ
jgi:hypothetical protein